MSKDRKSTSAITSIRPLVRSCHWAHGWVTTDLPWTSACGSRRLTPVVVPVGEPKKMDWCVRESVSHTGGSSGRRSKEDGVGHAVVWV